jgi:hypothetical protein
MRSSGPRNVLLTPVYEAAAEKREAEAAAKAEEPKLEASRAFAQAYHAWLVAKAETENPSVEDEELADRFSLALPAAERRLMVTALSLSGSTLAEAGGIRGHSRR